jgi:hypothetical protein
MTKKTQDSLVEYLVDAKYPRPPRIFIGGKPVGGVYSDASGASDNAERASYRVELLELTEAALEELFQQTQDAIKRLRDLAATKRDDKLFNNEEQLANLRLWAQKAYWSLDEAIALLLGKNPDFVNLESVRSAPRYPISPFVERYKELHTLVNRAVATKDLSLKVFPRRFIAWAVRLDLECPDELKLAVKKYALSDLSWKDLYFQHKDLYDSESETVAKLTAKCQLLTDKLAEVHGKTPSVATEKSAYWNGLAKRINDAADKYLAWSDTQTAVQKSGNLHEWLTTDLAFTNREAETAKKILSENFKNIM